MKGFSIRKYLLYLIRWQLSTPILWAVITFINIKNDLTKTIIANLIGGMIFFWVDALIFRTKEKAEK